MKRRVASLVLVIALVAGAFLTSRVSAHHVVMRDRKDTRAVLDIRRVEVKGTQKRPRWKIVSWREWTVGEIFDSGFTAVYLDTFGKPRFDYYALVRSNGRRLRAHLWRDRANKRDFKVTWLRVWRPDRSTLALRIPLRKMRIGTRRLEYMWYVQTIVTSNKCPRVCFDFAPDEGAVGEPLPVATPSVSPVPTPTPSPSP